MSGPRPVLHVYGQRRPHDDVYIVGDHASLRALRNALDAALVRDNSRAQARAYTSDGRGYVVHTAQVGGDTPWTLMPPYSAPEAAPHPWQGTPPQELIRLLDEQYCESSDDNPEEP